MASAVVVPDETYERRTWDRVTFYSFGGMDSG